MGLVSNETSVAAGEFDTGSASVEFPGVGEGRQCSRASPSPGRRPCPGECTGRSGRGVAVCAAPDDRVFVEQVGGIRGIEYSNWVCTIAQSAILF